MAFREKDQADKTAENSNSGKDSASTGGGDLYTAALTSLSRQEWRLLPAV